MPRSIIIYNEKECLQCKKIFKYSADQKTRKYCGYVCAKASRERRVTLVCPECNKEFIVQSWNSNARYCSYECKYKAQSSELVECTCASCKKTFIRKEHRANRANNTFCSLDCANDYNRGENHYEYKESLHDKDINTALHQWAVQIKERDNYICQECGDTRRSILEAHHVLSRSDRPDLIFELDNGITYCLWCHYKQHTNDVRAARLIMHKINRYENTNNRSTTAV